MMCKSLRSIAIDASASRRFGDELGTLTFREVHVRTNALALLDCGAGRSRAGQRLDLVERERGVEAEQIGAHRRLAGVAEILERVRRRVVLPFLGLRRLVGREIERAFQSAAAQAGSHGQTRRAGRLTVRPERSSGMTSTGISPRDQVGTRRLPIQ